MPSNVLVSGLSDAQYNGLYVYDGDYDEKPSYRLGLDVRILWELPPQKWVLNAEGNIAFSLSNVAYPWLATGWINDSLDPTGLVLTETPDNTIFNLQPSVAALIISRHGSVKRFLRLRLLGYI